MANFSMQADAASSGAEPSKARVRAGTKWAIALFFVVLVIPGSFYIGVRMSPYRLFLLIMAIPMLLRLRNDPTIRLTVVDVLVFLSIFWRAVSLLANHGLDEIVFAFATFAELFLGYLLGRTYVRSAADFRWFFNCFLAALVFFLPFALLEMATQTRVLRNLWGVILVQAESPTVAQVRFGVMRAMTAFEHPTIFGGFCAIGFANLYYLYLKQFPLNFLFASFAAFMSALAISSSSVIVLGLQAALIFYDRMIRGSVTYKWFFLVLFVVVIWYSFSLITGKTVPEYIITEIMFSPISGEARTLHYIYGSQEVLRHPLFGVGQNPWGSPYWLSQNMDSFWLSLSVRYGLPALILTLAALVMHLLMVFRSTRLDEEELNIRTGYMISFGCTVLMFSSVSFFAATLMFFMAFCGAGAWLYDTPRGRAPMRLRDRAAPRVAPAMRAPLRPRPGQDLSAEGVSRRRVTPSVPQSRG
jgi:hypothetical protein